MADNIRSYTNSEGFTVEVSEKHLDKAVHIKMELQNAVPSRKCNWKKHKEMMRIEGYGDSDVNEAYRCLVKDHQKSLGLLLPVDSYADMVASSKLESINRAIGEIYSEKRENQIVLNKLNALKRDLSLSLTISNEIRDIFIDNTDFIIPDHVCQPRLKNGNKNKAIIILTDLHIGSLVNIDGNLYNFEIAEYRLRKYLNKVIEICKRFQITDLYVCGLGDFIEHVYMRAKQNDEVEFKLAEQILRATKLIIEFLVGLTKFFNVEYSGIAGNHDRLQGNKDISYDDDNANVIINANIQSFIELTKSKRLKFVDVGKGATKINKVVNGKRIQLIHGHRGKLSKNTLQAYCSLNNEFIDCLIHGHLHTYYVQESDNGRLVFGVGSVIGKNSYSINDIQSGNNASQGILIVTEDGDMLPLKVDLQTTE